MANSSHFQDAVAIQHAVLPSNHPYQYAQNIGRDGTINLVARIDGAIVAYASVLIDRPDPSSRHLWKRLRPYLAFVGVLPNFQRQGIGVALVRRALQLSDPHRTSGIWLECEEGAATFYEKAGFSRVTPEAVRKHSGIHPQGLVYRITSAQLGGLDS
ncbi:GNAT family N-acetyltransferase [Cognatiluteimonas weifangensis]